MPMVMTSTSMRPMMAATDIFQVRKYSARMRNVSARKIADPRATAA